MLERVKLFYVDNISQEITKFCDSQPELIDKFDIDLITGIWETDITLILPKHLKYIHHTKNEEIKKIYLKNATEITYAHLIVILHKYPNASIDIFLSLDDEKNTKCYRLNILDTNKDDLIIVNLRSQ